MTNGTVRFFSVAIAASIAGCSAFGGMFSGNTAATPEPTVRSLRGRAGPQTNQETTPRPEPVASEYVPTSEPSTPVPYSPTPRRTFAPTPTPYPCPVADGSKPLLWGELTQASGSIGRELKLTTACWGPPFRDGDIYTPMYGWSQSEPRGPLTYLNPEVDSFPSAIGTVDDTLFVLVKRIQWGGDKGNVFLQAIFSLSEVNGATVNFELYKEFRIENYGNLLTPAPGGYGDAVRDEGIDWRMDDGKMTYPFYWSWKNALPGAPKSHAGDVIDTDGDSISFRLSPVAGARFETGKISFGCAADGTPTFSQEYPEGSIYEYYSHLGTVAVGERYAMFTVGKSEIIGKMSEYPFSDIWAEYPSGTVVDRNGNCQFVGKRIFSKQTFSVPVYGTSNWHYGLDLPVYSVQLKAFVRMSGDLKYEKSLNLITEDEIETILSATASE